METFRTVDNEQQPRWHKMTNIGGVANDVYEVVLEYKSVFDEIYCTVHPKGTQDEAATMLYIGAGAPEGPDRSGPVCLALRGYLLRLLGQQSLNESVRFGCLRGGRQDGLLVVFQNLDPVPQIIGMIR